MNVVVVVVVSVVVIITTIVLKFVSRSILSADRGGCSLRLTLKV